MVYALLECMGRTCLLVAARAKQRDRQSRMVQARSKPRTLACSFRSGPGTQDHVDALHVAAQYHHRCTFLTRPLRAVCRRAAPAKLTLPPYLGRWLSHRNSEIEREHSTAQYSTPQHTTAPSTPPLRIAISPFPSCPRFSCSDDRPPDVSGPVAQNPSSASTAAAEAEAALVL
jgi:hypothetical protein